MPQLTWLIRGWSSRLGEALLCSILARGDKVVATTRGNVSRISALAEARAKTFSLDVTAPLPEINAVIRKVLEDGQIDVLVNKRCLHRSWLGRRNLVSTILLSSVETNCFTVVKMTQAVLPHFREKNSGTVIFVGSSGGYCGTKHALDGWYDCLEQEAARLNIKSIISSSAFSVRKCFASENIKNQSTPIPDYDPVRNAVAEFVQHINGNQRGDPKEAAEVMIDVVKGEGKADGKVMPERLPLAPDCLATIRKKCVRNLAICNEWEDVIRSTAEEVECITYVSAVICLPLVSEFYWNISFSPLWT
ncbi:NAD(P)-binding protein [Westerdykella ornata]|uniref:NAD(P)-binding protein n=1 Tax=Westerdykella ornata TaxID=318751 RepID=A0A6A6K153_WESOR|nr:NAD(P)-binding protein [Westerdykella ornata]KAF2281079.1 NAD(P)-binding protein [Westerdykella ornata]